MSDKPGHTDRPLAWVAAAEDPPPAPASVDVALDALHDALQRGQVDAVIDAGLGAARAGVSPERLAAVVVGCAQRGGGEHGHRLHGHRLFVPQRGTRVHCWSDSRRRFP